MPDLTGQKFNKLTIIKEAPSVKGRPYWECLCDCGQTAIVEHYRLTSGNTKSCGCLKHQKGAENPHFINLTGKRFGWLTVIGGATSKNGRTFWECLCNCGRIKALQSQALISGKTKSCGCMRATLAIKNRPQPSRSCLNCGKLLIQKTNESNQTFLQRKTCGFSCARPLHWKELDRLKPDIERLYAEEHYSAAETGKKLGLSDATIFSLLRRFNIPIRAAVNGHKRLFDNNNKIRIDEEIREIFDGIMLGDGSIDKNKLVLSQEASHRDWVESVASKFEEHCFDLHIRNNFPKSTPTLTRNPTITLNIHHCAWFDSERKRWYPNGRKKDGGGKVVPIDVRITPHSVAHWYMGDGNLCHNNWSIATDSFRKEECELLAAKLNKLMKIINIRVITNRGHLKKYGVYYRIVTTKIADIKKISHTIQPYILTSFDEKLNWEKQFNIYRTKSKEYQRIRMLDPKYRERKRERQKLYARKRRAEKEFA